MKQFRPTSKALTYDQALQRLTALCSRSEHSSAEVREKARQWQLSEKEAQQLLNYLVDERYVDDTRYCRAYTLDKLRYNYWGRIKIRQMLHLQGLEEEDIQEGLNEITDNEYQKILTNILKSKSRSIHDEDPYIRQQKLLRYAAGKGFEPHLILRLISTLNAESDIPYNEDESLF